MAKRERVTERLEFRVEVVTFLGHETIVNQLSKIPGVRKVALTQREPSPVPGKEGIL